MQLFYRILTGFIAVLPVFILAACGAGQTPKAPPPQVSAVTVHTATVPVSYEYPGRVAGYKETEVRARVGGILLKRNFDEGARVAQDQLLFEIDPSVYEAAYASQQAQLAQARANYAQAVLDADRAEALWQKRFQSTAYRDQMAAKRDADAATVQQAEAQLRQAKLNLEYTKVTAPIGGMTSREHVSEGSLIATDASSNLLTTITQTDPVYINFSYTGDDARAIRRLMDDMRRHGEDPGALKVQIRFGDGHDYARAGTVDFTSPRIDLATGALGVRAIVANPDDILVPGQFVRLIVQGLKVNNALTMPEQALMQDNSGQYVYVVSAQGEVEKRPVRIDRQLASRNWLLAPGQTAAAAQEDSYVEPGQEATKAPQVYIGLRDGERVITEGQFSVGNALVALPQGAKLKVTVTALDGKPVAPPAAGQGR
ncbi:MAG: efflux RND transporter periplasmic adaptor subunit [Candidatus Tokpelaia sp.]|nr:MAG: efflux RND transporter periplasmic adaptor subunit [Candidatus Tokpelaia sp.]KAA6207089.1 MAG: efflux RND transporter periplasmic adaptor subunit [Candidatus Tokpelaia sp.]